MPLPERTIAVKSQVSITKPTPKLPMCGLLVIAVLPTLSCLAQPQVVTVNVPGKANPWLAGMPDGSVAGSGYDTAPNASPVQAPGVQVSSSVVFTFSANGRAQNYPTLTPQIPPEGDTSYIIPCWSAPENGMANISAPACGIVGRVP